MAISNKKRFEGRIARKMAEIQDLEVKIREARAYIQAMQDAIKLLPRDEDAPVGTILREGSAVAQARNAILKAGQPLHISNILEELQRPVDRSNRASLSGSISAYVRRGEIFTRPAPNTFGLVEMAGREVETTVEEEDSEVPDWADADSSGLPPNFGVDEPEEGEEEPF